MLFIWVIAAALLQVTVLRSFNLLVVLVVLLGLRKGPLGGLLIGGAIGIFAEIFSPSVFGSNVVLYSLLGLSPGILRSRIYYKENLFTEFMFTFCGVMLFYFAYFILNPGGDPSIISAALFSAFFSPLIFKISGGGRIAS
ncbi:hypothetical protein ACFL28_01270 [Candidatus Omnitrophota bacterium]